MNAKQRLIIALDLIDKKACLDMLEILSPVVDVFKIGIVPFTLFGQEILTLLEKKRKKVFLDLKFHDIPNTVRAATHAAAAKGIFIMNFHCLGGEKMLRAARQGADEGAASVDKEPPILLGVTVLTSMSTEDLAFLGIPGTAEENVLKFARVAKESGMNGVVASAEEAEKIKKTFGRDFIVVAPGIRPSWAKAGDQKRIMTPAEAVRNGADYIVVGRPILESDDPARAAREVIGEMA